MKSTKILFVCPYPFDEAPSQRFRFEQYLPILKKEGYQYHLSPFLNRKAWKILYESGSSIQKLLWLGVSFIKRFLLLFKITPYQYIFIHREASPVGPPFFEWAVHFIWRKKIIYDFDDAIWLADPNEKGSLKAKLKCKSKVNSICKWSYKVSCGNEYLAQFASEFNKNVIVNPTTIDTSHHQELKRDLSKKTVIGWTGTHSTLSYLKDLIPVLNQISTDHEFELLVISNKQPDFEIHSMRYLPWRKKTEIEDLNRIDIGIMPLTDDIWSQGKCGFKILQYMAVGKPVVASPVGVNEKLIKESQAGLAAESSIEWKKELALLLNDGDLRNELGSKGRAYIENNYSVKSNKENFLTIFQ